MLPQRSWQRQQRGVRKKYRSRKLGLDNEDVFQRTTYFDILQYILVCRVERSDDLPTVSINTNALMIEMSFFKFSPRSRDWYTAE